MADQRTKYDEEYKKNAVQLSYASPKSVREVAFDIGIGEALLYRWRKKYRRDGELTETAQLEVELKRMRLENAKLKMETDMLRKATAYFASLHTDGTHS